MLLSYSLLVFYLCVRLFCLEDCLVCLIILGSFHSACPKMLEGSSKGKMLDHQCVEYCWAHYIYMILLNPNSLVK